MPKPQSILVIEHDVDIAQLMVAILSPEYYVRTLGSAVDALKILKNGRADLILCDACLPTLNGYSFIAQLRSDAETKLIPTVIMSGLDDGFGEDYAREVGAVDVLPKPFSVPELWAVVREHIARPGLASRSFSERH